MDRLDPDGDLQTASVVTRTANGEVVALVGGRAPRATGFNRALDARRPAGSLLKPAVYLAALEQPERYTLATVLDDSSCVSPVPMAALDAAQLRSRVPRRGAAAPRPGANSYNQASARLGMAIGVPAVVDMLRRLGLRQDGAAVPSLVLGAGEYSPLMMARLYQTIAVDGTRTPLRSILSIVNREGEPAQQLSPSTSARWIARATHLLHYALREVVREGTGRGVYRVLPADFSRRRQNRHDQRRARFLVCRFLRRSPRRDLDRPRRQRAPGLTGLQRCAASVWAEFMAAARERPP
jgi:penicillin-binding protein 1B